MNMTANVVTCRCSFIEYLLFGCPKRLVASVACERDGAKLRPKAVPVADVRVHELLGFRFKFLGVGLERCPVLPDRGLCGGGKLRAAGWKLLGNLRGKLVDDMSI